MATTDPDWRARAACRDKPKSMFFPPMSNEGEANTREGQAAVAAAKEVCRGCNVTEACAEFGFREPEGVWFGTTPKERRAMARRGRRPMAATA